MKNPIFLLLTLFLAMPIACGKSYLTSAPNSGNSETTPTATATSSTMPMPTSAAPLTYQGQFSSYGTGNGQIQNKAMGVVYSPNGNIYVADTMNARVEEFTPAGTYVAQWGSNGSGPNQFNGLSAIAVDSKGNIFTTDEFNYRVCKFDPNGKLLATIGSFGQVYAAGVFDVLRAIAVDNHDNVYVLDSATSCVQRFDDNLNFIQLWKTNGSWNTLQASPDGICADNWGNIYIPDQTNGHVIKYSNTGTYECTIGSPGTGNGQLNQPSCGVCVDNKGCVYVADSGDLRIEVYNANGAYLCQWGNTGSNALVSFDYFCLDPTGKVYVVDTSDVKIFQ